MEVFIVMLGIFFGLLTSTFSGVQGKARDTERQTDIKAMHGQVEAYYAQNGYYPSLSNLNDAAWRSQNMRGLDQEALKDPDGNDFTLRSNPEANSYSYSVRANDDKDCNNTTKECARYELTATLDDGTTFSKQNLN